MKPLYAVLPLAALAATGCGHDPRDAFVGAWQLSGSTTTNLLVGGQPQNQTSPSTPGTYIFSASASTPGEIQWATAGCDWAADVTTDQSFTVKRNVCPPTTSSSCVFTITITDGTGTRTGENLSLHTRGDVVGTCGSTNVTGTILGELSGSKTTY